MSKEIKNLKAAAERILQAAKNQEPITIYGDSDLDGIASVVILQEAITTVGGTIADILFPNREEDGYGINKKALALMQQKKPSLFVTLDLGISNLQEVKALKEMGFPVIIIDHHQILKGIPQADVVVDPQQADD